MENFWQANFWGIAGIITGILGLIISWINWKYFKPEIEIAETKLSIPGSIVWNSLVDKKLEEIKYASLDYNLYIRLKNKKGGPGSIEKPTLIIKVSNENLEINISPRTKSYESNKIDSNTYSTKVIRRGDAWNFNGGETIDDELDYKVRGSNNIYKIVNNREKLLYFVEYQNNFGKKFIKKIENIQEQT